jgi:hypothetical protein
MNWKWRQVIGKINSQKIQRGVEKTWKMRKVYGKKIPKKYKEE